MKARQRHLLTEIRATFWFVPGLMVVGGALLALLTAVADTSLAAATDLPAWVYAGDADGARALLSTAAPDALHARHDQPGDARHLCRRVHPPAC